LKDGETEDLNVVTYPRLHKGAVVRSLVSWSPISEELMISQIIVLVLNKALNCLLEAPLRCLHMRRSESLKGDQITLLIPPWN
jgi:hypothetical protein